MRWVFYARHCKLTTQHCVLAMLGSKTAAKQNAGLISLPPSTRERLVRSIARYQSTSTPAAVHPFIRRVSRPPHPRSLLSYVPMKIRPHQWMSTLQALWLKDRCSKRTHTSSGTSRCLRWELQRIVPNVRCTSRGTRDSRVPWSGWRITRRMRTLTKSLIRLQGKGPPATW